MGSYDGRGYSTGNYVDPTDQGAKNLRQRKDQFYNQMYLANSAFWQQASIDKRFKVGDQSLWSMIYGDNQYFQARRFFFNLIRRHINMITGYQRRNRKSTITMPIQSDSDPLADDYNKCLKWGEDRDGFQEYLSQAFEGAVDTGISLLHMYPDYTYDPISGDLFTDQVAYPNFMIDTFFRKQDLSDCSGIWRRRWPTKTQAKALLPGMAKEIDKMRPAGAKDGRFPLQAELLNMDVNQMFALDEFHYRDSREGTMLLDPKTGEATEWEDEDDEDSEDMLKQVLRMQPWLKVKKVQIPTVKLCLSLNDNVVYDGPNLLNIDMYPFAPALCYHEPDIQSYTWRLQGVVRNLRDAQYLYNLRKVIECDLLMSQVQNAWIYPIDVVVDPKAFRQTANGCVIPLKAGHLPNEIQRLEPQAIPQSVMELSRSLSEDITRISGVTEELLGSSTQDKAGIIEAMRQAAGITTLQGVLDKIDYTQRIYGKIRLEAMRKNFSKGKVSSILGHEADPRFFTSRALKYGVAVEEGNFSTTQRQMELQQLLHFRELGMPIADKTIINKAFISGKKQVIEDMEEQAEQQAEAQKAEQAQQEKMDNSKIMAAYAKSRSDLASAEEKVAKVKDLQAGAQHKSAQADLDLVKMMVELEDMDMAHRKNTFEMAQAIKQANQQTAINQ